MKLRQLEVGALVALSVVLLAVIGIAAVWGQLVVAARDVQNELADESNKNTPNTCDTSDNSDTPDDNDLSDTERALIKLLRNNDIPPDVVAESLREVME